MTIDPESKLTRQVEWFHQFAEQSAGQLAAQATEENRALFKQYVIACLPGHDPPEGQSPEEFACNVLELRKNESGWNQALMSALIRADDLYKEQAWQSAVATLQSFAGSCPWKLFSEAARNQACNYKSH
ncbi:hypothetical protein [Polaromonas sp. YR568]|uniref:hypothetical protein n=1 Tax=Polaromonas sp. YR568 TaxID=1855301 RepID=UPI000B82C479|nr:hypothetical protein [Polaromonas sp. YR568]